MSQTDVDRHHAATPHKLAKARERGQVAKSQDVVSAAVMAAALVFLAWQGMSAWHDLLVLCRSLLGRAVVVEGAQGLDGSLSAMASLLSATLRAVLLLLAPFLCVVVLASAAGNLLQTGPVLSLHPVKPDWQRLDPAEGLKRVLSTRTLFVALRALLKLGLLAMVVYWALKALWPQFYLIAQLHPAGLVPALADDVVALGVKMTIVLALIAVIDLAHARREFAGKMRMSQREIKDEAKQREGDPRIRARLRELRRELRKRTLGLQRTRGADVLITNPVHVAVALRYVHGEMASPQLVAKGRGFMAAAMRAIAARHGIPVVQSPTLARALYRDLSVDQHVQPAQFAPVARIVVWVLARRAAAADRGTAAA